MHRLVKILIPLFVILMVGMGASECEGDTSTDKQRASSVKSRATTFARAEAKYPLPRTENFPLRRMLVEMTKRDDLANHPWYIYHMADSGNVIGYYVGKTTPINACNFLSSTQEVKSDAEGKIVLQAPSIDGIYYGSADCNMWVWEDYTTSAVVKVIAATGTIVAVDKPLNIEAEAIKVKR